MKNQKYHTIEATPKSSIHIHDRSLSLLSTGASIDSVRIKLLLHAQPAHLSEIMWSCKYFQLVSKMPTLTYSGRTAKLLKKTIILNIIQDIFNPRGTEVVI